MVLVFCKCSCDGSEVCQGFRNTDSSDTPVPASPEKTNVSLMSLPSSGVKAVAVLTTY